MLPAWLKPSYIAIALLAVLLGVQTVRLAGSQSEVAEAVLKERTLVADIATARVAGIQEGAARQKIAYDALQAAHLAIVKGLEEDKQDIQKRYDATTGVLHDLAKIEKWACLKEPLPEPVLQEFRR